MTKIKEKIIVVAPTTAVPISTGFEVALKVFPAPSFSSKYLLSVICYRAVRVNCDCNRPHTQKSESYKPESKY